MTPAEPVVCCPACGRDDVPTTLQVIPRRLFVEIGECACGAWLEWDGERVHVRTPGEIARLMQGERLEN
jgi:hypothetical protein